MKVLLGIFLTGLLMVVHAGSSFAVDQTYTLSAAVPAASGIGFTASSVNATTGVFTPVAGAALTFNPMAFDATNQIWLPNHYFALDISATGGAGSTDATFKYTEGANPNAPAHGLGWKSAATFVRVNGTIETPLTGHGTNGKKLLKDVLSEHIIPTELVGGRLRAYLGVNTGDATTPATGEVFSNADRAGTYAGTLLISATPA